MYAMSPLRNAGVFEALLRLSCMTCPLGVHGGRSTWKTADRSRKSNNSQANIHETGCDGCEFLGVHRPITAGTLNDREFVHLAFHAPDLACLRVVPMDRSLSLRLSAVRREFLI